LVHSPKGFNRHVFGRSRVAHDAQHPSIDGSLVVSKQRLEGVHLALAKPVEDVAFIALHCRFPFSFNCALRRKKVTPE
jgi:hypothetical protein